jgi:membrane protein implicated in regulation of membrane protease activity
MCHIILFMPLLTLPIFWLLPLNIALPVYLVILALSAWLYYFVMVAMRKPVVTGIEHLLHSQGEVIDAHEGHLHVRVDSEIWQAESNDALQPGDQVKVTGIDHMHLGVSRNQDHKAIGEPAPR